MEDLNLGDRTAQLEEAARNTDEYEKETRDIIRLGLGDYTTPLWILVGEVRVMQLAVAHNRALIAGLERNNERLLNGQIALQ